MSDRKILEDSSFWIGVGSYYALSWLFTFYPAFIVGLTVCQLTDPEVLNPEFTGFVVALVVWVLLILCLVFEKYKVLVFAYAITLWPFLHQVYSYWFHLDSGPGQTNECFPLPPVDWWPLW